MTSTAHTAYHRLLASSLQVKETCRLGNNALASRVIRVDPTISLVLVDQHLTLPKKTWSTPLLASIKTRMEGLLEEHAGRVQRNVQLLYRDALKQTLSVEEHIGLSDSALQLALQRGFEALYQRLISRTKTVVVERIRLFNEQSKKTAGFCQVSSRVLSVSDENTGDNKCLGGCIF